MTSSNISWPQTDALMTLKGKTAIVTGAGAGIGRSIACMLASAGAGVVVVDQNPVSVEATSRFIEEHGGRALPVSADVADLSATKTVLISTLDHFHQIDVLVNNAGIYPSAQPLPHLDSHTFESTFRVNVEGTLNYICEAAKMMDKGGSIINISSNVSLRPPGPGIAHYATSKAAINALTRSAAVDLASQGIRVNAVLPGIVVTEGTSALEDRFQSFVDRTPSGRIGLPEDIATVALFLASAASSFINGQCLAVDGGASIVG